MIKFKIKNPPIGTITWNLMISDQFWSPSDLSPNDAWSFTGVSLNSAELRFLAYDEYGGYPTLLKEVTIHADIVNGKNYIFDWANSTLSEDVKSASEGDSGWLKWLGLGIGGILAIAFVRKWRK